MNGIADIVQDSERDFLASHPWITFRLDLSRISWRFWEQLGEARSKCLHLSRTPLPPVIAKRLYSLYLAKGARATTAIEGNTLSEDQALAAVENRLELPASQEYLGREIENILMACATIGHGIYEGGDRFELSPKRLKALNGMVLGGLEVEEHVVAGEFRRDPIVVGGVYRGVPAADCEYLVGQLCDWLNDPAFQEAADESERFQRAFLRAALAHIYIAWIHPFGDGNGRTARLVEFGTLIAAGVPAISAHLLSNHYNATRSVYYRELDYASKSGGDLSRFLLYAIEGFVGELQQQLDQVHGWNFQAAWTNYVHEIFGSASTPATRRQRQLVLALPPADPVGVAAIPTLTPELALAYAGKGRKTVTRDINALAARGLIERRGNGIRARRELMLGFLPPVAGEAAT